MLFVQLDTRQLIFAVIVQLPAGETETAFIIIIIIIIQIISNERRCLIESKKQILCALRVRRRSRFRYVVEAKTQEINDWSRRQS